MEKPSFTDQFKYNFMVLTDSWVQNTKENILMFESPFLSFIKDHILHQNSDLRENSLLQSAAVNTMLLYIYCTFQELNSTQNIMQLISSNFFLRL